MSARMKLGVVYGGRSAEHEVSVVSAMDVLREADAERFETVPFGVTAEGRWLTPAESRTQLARRTALFHNRMSGDVPPLLERTDVLGELRALDVVLPLVHGTNGEDGTLQGMLESFGIPYAGCGVEASAIGMDKATQKQLFAAAGLRVARHLVVFEDAWVRDADAMAAACGTLGYPLFVKPANGGSSIGVSRVRSREDLGDAMREAFALDRKVLVEEAVPGRELDCGVLGNEAVEASPVGEVVTSGEFYDYRAKYLDEGARIIAPADVPPDAAARVQEHAVRAFRAITGEGFARLDFFLPDEGEPVVNEVNTIPGFRPSSMFPRLWAEAGIAYRELITRVVELGLARAGRDRARAAARAEGEAGR